MLTPDQINTIHRLHLIDKWSVRKIARQLQIGRHTVAKYIETPAPPPAHRDRASKLNPFKPAIDELLERDPAAPAAVIAERLRTLGFDGGITILKDYLQALRADTKNRRAYVRMEPGPGERFEVERAQIDALDVRPEGAASGSYAHDTHRRILGSPYRRSIAFLVDQCASRRTDMRMPRR